MYFLVAQYIGKAGDGTISAIELRSIIRLL
jgi:hypothetical protein